MEIFNKKEFVSIVDSNSNKTIYPIRKSILDRTRNGNLSEWIIQLSGKKWVYTDLLYQLARVIIKEYPENSIDWEATFFRVEKSRIMQEAIDLDDSKEGSLFDRMMKKIDLGQQLSADWIDAKIKKIVSLELQVNGILVSNN